jgi:hypothetical protein
MSTLVGCSCTLLEAPRGPFNRHKEPRSRWKQSRKANLAFCRVAHRTVRCTTGHCPVPDFLPEMEQSTVAVLEPLAQWTLSGAHRTLSGAHRTLSGAHRTVRCLHLTVGSATRHARIAWPTVGPADRWLTGQSGVPLDSLVNYSRTPSASPESGLFTRVQPGAPDTVRCTTGQSGVPDFAESWLYTAKHFAFLFFSSFLCF